MTIGYSVLRKASFPWISPLLSLLPPTTSLLRLGVEVLLVGLRTFKHVHLYPTRLLASSSQKVPNRLLQSLHPDRNFPSLFTTHMTTYDKSPSIHRAIHRATQKKVCSFTIFSQRLSVNPIKSSTIVLNRYWNIYSFRPQFNQCCMNLPNCFPDGLKCLLLPWKLCPKFFLTKKRISALPLVINQSYAANNIDNIIVDVNRHH